MIGVLTASERAHEAFYRRMAEEGVCIEYTHPPIPSRQFDYTATFKGYEPGDPIGRGPDAESAYLDLMEQAGE